MTTFKIIKSTNWNPKTLKMDEEYIVWAGNKCLGIKNSEKNANELYEIAKKNYRENEIITLKEETL